MTGETAGNEILPWHRGCWDTLRAARDADRLPHALLIAGPAGVGKRRLVSLFARSLLCQRLDSEGFPCGICRDCQLLAAGTHPDYLQIGPDEQGKSKEIRVDTVRRLVDADALTASRGVFKVILVDPAQQLNTAAANSLLKTLEEPAPGTLLFLISEQPGRLPATIRSRCQVLKVPVPAESVALEWLSGQAAGGVDLALLRLAQGAPLRALLLSETGQLAEREKAFSGFAAVGNGVRDPIAEAAAWSHREPAVVLDWLSSWLSDMLRLTSGHPKPRLDNVDKVDVLRALAERLEPAEGHRFLRDILRARKRDHTTLNPLLLYESLLVEWAGIARL
ncbi:MAG: DNA polymerase III subunit delta' [Pseudomonadota bacterium]|nr:DNA polymerase III subunit delta' [Pseudomonadota bacterium]